MWRGDDATAIVLALEPADGDAASHAAPRRCRPVASNTRRRHRSLWPDFLWSYGTPLYHGNPLNRPLRRAWRLALGASPYSSRRPTLVSTPRCPCPLEAARHSGCGSGAGLRAIIALFYGGISATTGATGALGTYHRSFFVISPPPAVFSLMYKYLHHSDALSYAEISVFNHHLSTEGTGSAITSALCSALTCALRLTSHVFLLAFGCAWATDCLHVACPSDS